MKGFWRDAKGINHRIKDMPKKYILNCIRCLRKNMNDMADALGSDAMENAEFLDMAEKAVELNQELLRRFGEGVELSQLTNPVVEQVGLTVEENDKFWETVKGGMGGKIN